MKKLSCLFVLLMSCASTKYIPQVKAQTTKVQAFQAWELANPPKEECKQDVKATRDQLVAIVKEQGALILEILGKKNGPK